MFLLGILCQKKKMGKYFQNIRKQDCVLSFWNDGSKSESRIGQASGYERPWICWRWVWTLMYGNTTKGELRKLLNKGNIKISPK